MKQPFYMTVGGRLRRHQHSLVIERTDPEAPDAPPIRLPVPIEQVSAVYALGEVDLNARLVSLLARHGVLLHFFDYYGNYTATLYPRPRQLSGRLHVQQAIHYLRPKRRMRLIRSVLDVALANMRRVLLYYRRAPSDAAALEAAAATLADCRARLRETTGRDALLGLEGHARHVYYGAWNAALGLDGTPFAFTRRIRRPPGDPLNALISFGNSLCYTTVLRQLHQTALDPTIGYLHEPADRRFSLALDLSELVKPVLVDRAILRLLRSGRITERHFTPRDGGVYLNEVGRRRVVEHWDARLQRTFHHRGLNRPVRYEEWIRMAAHALVSHLESPVSHPFKAFRFHW